MCMLVRITNLLMEASLFDWMKDKEGVSIARIGPISDIYSIPELSLKGTDEMRGTLIGTNFLNGFFCGENRELEPSLPKYFLIHVLSCNSDFDAMLDKETKKYLQQTIPDPIDLSFLRTGIYRYFFPNKQLQVGLFFTGPPATGKSCFLNCISKMVRITNCLFVSKTDLESKFEKISIKNKAAFILSECDKLFPNALPTLKNVSV